jgi:hypothetical protein
MGAGKGVHAWFTTDDLVNMKHYQEQSIGSIAKANLLFFSPSYRPLGGLFYAPLYSIFGLNPLPFRIVCFAFLILNLGLAWLLAYLLTGSHEVGALSTLIGAFHPRLADLYWSSGTIYDLACFTFFYAAMCLYVHIRRNGRTPDPRAATLILLFYIAALNAKEMAVAVPPLMIAYEMLFIRTSLRGLLKHARVPLLAGVLTIPYVWSKALLPASVLTRLDRYTPNLSLTQFLETYGSYLGQLAYSDTWFDVNRTAVFLLVSLVIGITGRSLLFSWTIAVVAALPIAFIPARTPFAFYIPLTGWTMYIALLLVRMRQRVHARAHGTVYAAITFAVVLLLLLRAHRIQRHRMGGPEILGQQGIKSVVTDLDRHSVRFPPSARVLAVNDPFSGEGYTLVILLRLYANDKSLDVHHARTDDCSYPVSLEWSGKQLKSIRRGPC